MWGRKEGPELEWSLRESQGDKGLNSPPKGKEGRVSDWETKESVPGNHKLFKIFREISRECDGKMGQ